MSKYPWLAATPTLTATVTRQAAPESAAKESGVHELAKTSTYADSIGMGP